MRSLTALLFVVATASCSSDPEPTADVDAAATDTGSATADTGTATTDTGTATADTGTATDALATDAPATDAPADAPASTLSFFITSVGVGEGAKLGGLTGADAHCKKLATAVGAGARNWRAYLSQQATGGLTAVNAKDRIGVGPWFNVKGVKVASSVAELHSAMNNMTKESALNEKGEVVKGRGDTPNQHDILTGSRADGTVAPGDADTTCKNWTSNSTGSATVGHHDRMGGGADPMSWNSAHNSSGCSQANLVGTGGNGYFYCFAAD